MGNKMKDDVKLVAAAVAALAAGAVCTDANASVLSNVPLTNDQYAAAALSGKATPAAVRDAMQSMGMDLLNSPLSGVNADGTLNPSAIHDKVSGSFASSNHYVLVWKDDVSARLGPDKTRAVAENLARRGKINLGDVLTELDKVADEGTNWHVTLAPDGKVNIG
jgi:hypothetical protein